MNSSNLEQWFQQLTERENRGDGSATTRESATPNPPERPARPEPTPTQARVRQLVRRAALRWLVEEGQPSGVGMDVITRIHRIRADLAAFWSRPTANARHEGPDRVLSPVRTVIVQCYAEREACWPDCADSSDAAPKLAELRAKQENIEADIREREPELRDANSLFEEFADWHYDRSQNPRYHSVRRDIETVEHALYAGTRFERIREAALADELWLAVPAHVLEPDELADGWGLLWVHSSLDVEIKREPMSRECLPENRMHLVQNIAAADMASVLFANGLRPTRRGVRFVKPARGHRTPIHPRLDDEPPSKS